MVYSHTGSNPVLTTKKKVMSSETKKRKSDKKLHWGRGRHFMKWVGKGIKGLTYFTSSQRRINNKIDLED
jgi:hypothetical protein